MTGRHCAATLVFTSFLTLVASFSGRLHLSENETEVFQQSLQSYCPFTSFCSMVAKQTWHVNTNSNTTGRCCQPCSCESDCGLKGNCCFQEDDLYDIHKNDIFQCVPISVHDFDKHSPGYYMIHKCFDRDTLCIEPNKSLSEALNPVHSGETKLIYLNEECALCNSVTDFVPWKSRIYCSLIPFSASNEGSLSDNIQHLLQRISSRHSSCEIRFEAPPDEDLFVHMCSHSIVRDCYRFTTTKASPETEKLCESFNATFVLSQHTNTYFGNIFCAMCNVKDKTELIKYPFCDIHTYNRGRTGPSITGLLRWRENKHTKHSAAVKPKVCSHLSSSTTLPRCRPLLCPEGQVHLGDKCELAIAFDIIPDYAYVLYVRLTPVNQGHRISEPLLQSLVQEELDTTSWLSRGGLERWDTIIYYHKTASGDDIEYLVVALFVTSTSYGINDVLDQVNLALQSEWTIATNGEQFDFKPDLNKHLKYSRSFNSNTFIPASMIYTHPMKAYVDNTKEHVHRLFIVNDIPTKSICIHSSFFCDQVDLHPTEYLVILDRVYLKNEDSFLEPGEYRLIKNSDSVTVRVCVDTWRGQSKNCVGIRMQLSMLLAFCIFGLF